MTVATQQLWDPVFHMQSPELFGIYQRMRDEFPVFHNTERDIWALTRYDDVIAALHDTHRFSSGMGVNVASPPSAGSPMISIISMDDPRHSQLRRLVVKAFTARQIGGFEPKVRAATRQLVDEFAGDGQVEFVSALGVPLPIIVISDLLGIDDADRELFKNWSDAMVRQDPDDPATAALANEAVAAINAYFSDVMRLRRRQPTDDLISLLLAAEIDGQRLNDDEILGFCFLLIVAGHETTTNFLGNCVVALAEHPAQRAALERDMTLVPNAVHELLRWCGSVHSQGRTTMTDVELHGVTIPAISRVAVIMGAANRDERQFGPDAGKLDIQRAPSHLAFGHGAHFCLGSHLARIEAQIVIEELLARLPDWRITDEAIAYAPSSMVRGPLRLNLEFTPFAG